MLLRSHVSHQVVDELLHLLDVLSGIRLELQADDVVGHLQNERAGIVVVFHHVAALQVIIVSNFKTNNK